MTTSIDSLGGTDPHPVSVNKTGMVAGTVVANGDTDQAVTWSVTGTTTCPDLPGDTFSIVGGINDQGQVVGASSTGPFDLYHAVLWRDGTATALTGTGVFGQANAINDQGQVVGVAANAAGNDDAFLWRNGTLTDLGALPGHTNPQGAFVSYAAAINNAGEVVGSALTSAGYDHPVAWQTGKITDLGGLTTVFTGQANAINANGEIVGQSSLASSLNLVHAVAWQNGTITDLGTLPGYESSKAEGIDSAGDIVGQAFDASATNSTNRAVLWQNGKMIDLTDLLPSTSGWVLTDATAINDQGQIVGQGTELGRIAGYILTLGSTPAIAFTSAQSLIQAFQGGTVPVAAALTDTAADVQANLAGLAGVAAAGKLSFINLTDAETPTLTVAATQVGTDATALGVISGTFNVTVTGGGSSVDAFLAQEDVTGRGQNGIACDYAGVAPAGGNSVLGFQNGSVTLSAGDNAIVLDNARSDYAIQVSQGGTVSIRDIGTGDATYGQTMTASGVSYLVFGDAASTAVAGLPVYNSIYFVETPADAQLAQFYAAATQFKDSIVLSGLEYWENRLAAGMSLESIAQSFLNTSYFQTTYGTPGTTHDQHVAFVQALYQNILGMTLNAGNGGVQYWAGQMDNGTLDGATTLISFTNASANTSVLNAVSGASVGGGVGWLIDPSATGGYADPGLQEAAATVLSQAATNNFYNLSLIDPTTVSGNGLSVGAATLLAKPGGLTLSAAAPASTVYLSASFTQVTVNNAGDTIHDGPGADSITVNGANASVILGQAGTDNVTLGGATNAYVFGFAAGHGSILAASGIANAMATSLLDGTTTAAQGASLSFGTTAKATPVYVEIGSVGGGSAAEVATAANKAYAVGDIAGNAASGRLGEHVMFIGTDSGGNAEIWSFGSAATKFSGADLNGNHQVDANEITLVATLVGVPATTLSTADLA